MSHEKVDREIVSTVRKVFQEKEAKKLLTHQKVGDNRIFHFEEFLDSSVSKVFFNRHIDYCDSIKIRRPKYMTLMVNHTWSERNSLGSGAGWHRDSGGRSQHKTFTYLSDVGIDAGPFCIHDHQNYYLSLLDNPRVRIANNPTFKFKLGSILEKKILGDEGFCFSCCTNFIHRGLPVIKGSRYMITVYAWNSLPPAPFNSYLCK